MEKNIKTYKVVVTDIETGKTVLNAESDCLIATIHDIVTEDEISILGLTDCNGFVLSKSILVHSNLCMRLIKEHPNIIPILNALWSETEDEEEETENK